MTKTVTISDRQGPRFRRGKFTYKISSKELFEEFKKNYPEYNINQKEFEHIWFDMLVPEIQKEVVINPLGFKAPFYIGELKLQWLPYRPEKYDFDYKTKTGDEVPRINLQNGGKVHKLKWERRNAVRYNRWLQFYGFTHNREIDRLAKKKLAENPGDMRVSRVTLGGAKHGLAPLKNKK